MFIFPFNKKVLPDISINLFDAPVPFFIGKDLTNCESILKDIPFEVYLLVF